MGRLLYFSPAPSGGLADYARQQANALVECGVAVDFLTVPKFSSRADDSFKRLTLTSTITSAQKGFRGKLAAGRKILAHQLELARTIKMGNYRQVLLASYSEYMAPLWAGRLKKLAGRGVVFGAVVHDPVRDYVVGPRWWHRRSIACGYSFLREAFVHEAITLDTVRPMPQLRTTVIPHGAYPFLPASKSSATMRAELNIPKTAKIWLSFGHIRDGKNLDLAIQALKEFPDSYLVVAGKEQSSTQKPVAFYQKLAGELGVANRCRWFNRFVAENEVGDFFAAADLVLLTYGKNFRSASGVLNAAVNFRKPCLASSGEGNLKTVIERYGLGIWVEPDSSKAMMDGLRQWVASPGHSRWDDYAVENSWELNALIVGERMLE